MNVDPTLRRAGYVARVIAFVLNHARSIISVLSAIFVCSFLSGILDIVFTPLKAFVVAAIITVVLCGGFFVHHMNKSINENDSDF
jgi:uncharacterized membrane protein YjjB (DUF3815 family)